MRVPLDGTDGPDSIELDRRRTIGKLSGALYLAGAVLALPAALLADPPLAPTAWIALAVGIASGLFFLLFPWQHHSPRWLHVIPIVAIVEITFAMRITGVHGSLYSWLYMLVAIGVAYSFRSRKEMALYMLLIAAAMATQLIDTPLSTRDVLRNIFVSIPALVICSAVIVFFRERLERGEREYRRLARLDPLTGVGNYRTLHERLDYEIARHERHGRSFAVLLIDLDDFKQVNETHGHLAGDRVLKQVGAALRVEVRDEDTVARQGGDEFSVLVPEAGPREAKMLERRLHEALARIDVGGRPLRVVVGWSVYPAEGDTPDTLLAQADISLLRGKHEEDGSGTLATVHELRPPDMGGGDPQPAIP